MILTEYNEEEFSLSEGEAEQYVKKVLSITYENVTF